MKKNLGRLAAFALLLALLAIPTMAVLAKELGALRIAGPGIKGTLTFNDPQKMVQLEDSGFFSTGQSSSLKIPDGLGRPYTISADLNLDGKAVRFVEMEYYPGQDGQPGYVHYTGRMNGETMQKVDEWASASVSGDKLFRDLLSSSGVTVQAAVPAPRPQPQAATPVEPAPVTLPAPAALPAQSLLFYIIIAVLAVLALAGTGLALRRRLIAR